MLKRARNPEGRMPLRAHLVELRNRVLVAGIAVLLGAVAGWIVYDDVFQFLIQPLRDIAADPAREVRVNFGNVATSFDLKVQISIWLGVILSSPVWIFQIWAFITPGLTRRERWYAIGFMLAAVPLFLSGLALAWLVLPNAITFLTGFTPETPDNFDSNISSNIIQAPDYLAFVTRLLLAFGIAFLIPVVMVALNFTGLITGRTLLKSWRVTIVLVFVFAAIASPTPEVTPMFALAGPMILLYFVAVGIALVNDWRRGRRDGTAALAGLDDDEASSIDQAPSAIEEPPSPVDERPSPLQEAPPVVHPAPSTAARP